MCETYHSKYIRSILSNTQNRIGIGKIVNELCSMVVRVDLPNLRLANQSRQNLAIASDGKILKPLRKSECGFSWILHAAYTEFLSTHSRIGKLVDSFDQIISVTTAQRRSDRKRAKSTDEKGSDL